MCRGELSSHHFFYLFDPADQEKEREESQKKLTEALQEKEQVASDLNNTERSFADLFKRLEKYKDVVQGYKKVGAHEHELRFHTIHLWHQLQKLEHLQL